MYLEQIHEANDIKKLNERELAGLAEEIRTFLVEKISKTGGHLASNLGVVELTMAMHLSFQLPEDKMIWDVGHQSYTHKILTGRKEGFDGLRKYGGMSGFPKRKESDCDAFDTGHSSTSISAGLGYARGRDILGQDYSVISVIGDGSLTGGMAYEALNNAAEMKTNFIIVLNDNHMSISKNVGGMSSYLGELRTAQAYTDLKDTVENVLGSIPFGGEKMVRFAVRLGAPAAVRYPRGSAFDGFREYRAPIEYGKSEPVYEEEDIAIISVGHMFEQAVQVRKRLKEIGYNCTLINARFVKPVDEEMLRKLTVEHRLIVTLEENIRRGGFGEFVTAYLAGLETDAEVLNLALPDDYIEHGSVDLLRSEVMLDIESCVARIITAYIAEESRRD